RAPSLASVGISSPLSTGGTAASLRITNHKNRRFAICREWFTRSCRLRRTSQLQPRTRAVDMPRRLYRAAGIGARLAAALRSLELFAERSGDDIVDVARQAVARGHSLERRFGAGATGGFEHPPTLEGGQQPGGDLWILLVERQHRVSHEGKPGAVGAVKL